MAGPDRTRLQGHTVFGRTDEAIVVHWTVLNARDWTTMAGRSHGHLPHYRTCVGCVCVFSRIRECFARFCIWVRWIISYVEGAKGWSVYLRRFDPRVTQCCRNGPGRGIGKNFASSIVKLWNCKKASLVKMIVVDYIQNIGKESRWWDRSVVQRGVKE